MGRPNSTCTLQTAAALYRYVSVLRKFPVDTSRFRRPPSCLVMCVGSLGPAARCGKPCGGLSSGGEAEGGVLLCVSFMQRFTSRVTDTVSFPLKKRPPTRPSKRSRRRNKSHLGSRTLDHVDEPSHTYTRANAVRGAWPTQTHIYTHDTHAHSHTPTHKHKTSHSSSLAGSL